MKDLKAAEEFVVGKHGIGWINNNFTEHFSKAEFRTRPVPTFQKLPRSMKDVGIEYELKPGYCGPGDILAFLDNAPEECKDGYANLFYTPAFVVLVNWHPHDRAWRVYAWHRDGIAWHAGNRVFSPATETSNTQNSTLGPRTSETLIL